jgi:FkbM family methyltransferase
MAYVDIQFAGRYFKLDAVDGTDQIVRDIVSGAYEAPLPMLMMATIVRTEGIFIDVGANTGLYSVMAAVISQGRKVIAFEPLPSVISALRRNIEINALESVIEVKEIALSSRLGMATLHIPDPGHGLLETSASLEAEFKTHDACSGAKSIEVKVSTLDSLEIHDPIAVIKVDIEGHEYAFLDGAKNTITRERPIVFIEVLRTPQLSRLGSIAQEMGYINFRLRPDLAIHDGGEIYFDPQAWNHALVPIERLRKFEEICSSCGVAMLRRFTLT